MNNRKNRKPELLAPAGSINVFEGAIKAGADVEYKGHEYPGKDSGRAYGGWLWIDNGKDRNTVIHELSHLIDDIMVLVHTDDTEFRAYLTGWIMDNVLKWIDNGGVK